MPAARIVTNDFCSAEAYEAGLRDRIPADELNPDDIHLLAVRFNDRLRPAAEFIAKIVYVRPEENGFTPVRFTISVDLHACAAAEVEESMYSSLIIPPKGFYVKDLAGNPLQPIQAYFGATVDDMDIEFRALCDRKDLILQTGSSDDRDDLVV